MLRSVHTDTVEMSAWWGRDRGPETSAWISRYQQSLTNRHRQVITQVMTELQPETLLEVGCHCGPNLICLARALPTCHMHGIDISPDAIQAGRTWCAVEQCADRVQLFEGRIPERIEQLPSKAYDVVLSSYALACIGPHDIDTVLYELGRLATRAIVLAEPNPALYIAPATTGYREWRHDYRARQRWIGTLGGWTLDARPIDPPVDALTEVLTLRAPAEAPGPGT